MPKTRNNTGRSKAKVQVKIRQPIEQVVWKKRDELCPNDYNPNHVSPPEMKLLKLSILEDGWTQPIVINSENVIVDGFHRWTVSEDDDISSMTDGKVPCVVLNEADQNQRKMATIRHNRARGTHAVLNMSDIVIELLKTLSKEEVMKRLQMEEEEVIRLSLVGGIPASDFVTSKDFNSSWEPE